MLKCNSCFKELNGRYYLIKGCGHIFCESCSNENFSKELICTACQTEFETNDIKLVDPPPRGDSRFFGFSPKHVLQAMNQSYSFLDHQRKIQIKFQEHISNGKIEEVKTQYQEKTKTLESKLREYESELNKKINRIDVLKQEVNRRDIEIENLRRENDALKRENEKLNKRTDMVNPMVQLSLNQNSSSNLRKRDSPSSGSGFKTPPFKKPKLPIASFSQFQRNDSPFTRGQRTPLFLKKPKVSENSILSDRLRRRSIGSSDSQGRNFSVSPISNLPPHRISESSNSIETPGFLKKPLNHGESVNSIVSKIKTKENPFQRKKSPFGRFKGSGKKTGNRFLFGKSPRTPNNRRYK